MNEWTHYSVMLQQNEDELKTEYSTELLVDNEGGGGTPTVVSKHKDRQVSGFNNYNHQVYASSTGVSNSEPPLNSFYGHLRIIVCGTLENNSRTSLLPTLIFKPNIIQ